MRGRHRRLRHFLPDRKISRGKVKEIGDDWRSAFRVRLAGPVEARFAPANWGAAALHNQDFHAVGDLIAAALRDRNAYAAVVKWYQDALRRYVRRLLGQHHGATDDILQEAFIKAYVNLKDYDPDREFGPWIYRIAHNEAISFLRRRKSEPAMVDIETATIILERLTDGVDAAQELEHKQQVTMVQTAMAALDRRYRDVLVLRFLEDHSYDEISEILAMRPGTVATNINRGLKELRIYLISTGRV